MGGQADTVAAYLREHHRSEARFEEAVAVAVHALEAGTAGQAHRRTRRSAQPANGRRAAAARQARSKWPCSSGIDPRRCFRRITGPALERLLLLTPSS